MTLKATVSPSGETFGDEPPARRRAPEPSSAATQTLECVGLLL
jgi:hypothetical protein